MTKSYWNSVLANRISRRRALAVTGGTALGSALLIACGSGGEDGGGLEVGSERAPGSVFFERDNYALKDTSKEAVPDGVHTTPIEDNSTEAFDPYLTVDPTSDRIRDHAYEYLMRANRGPGIQPGTPEYATMVGNLSDNLEIADDGLQFAFHLRPNVKFHDLPPVSGRVMDIEDWRLSLERYLEIATNSPAFKADVDHVTTPDANTMIFHLKAPSASLLNRLADYNYAPTIMPKELAADPELAKTQMIGTNFYVLDNYQPSVTREWRRFDEYWDGKPFIARWHEPIIPEYANRYSQFIAQRIQSFTPEPREVFQVRSDAPQAILIGNMLNLTSAYRMFFGKQEIETVPWRDRRVRIAMQRAVDWPAVNKFAANYDKFQAEGIEVELVDGTHVPPDPLYHLNPWKGELGKDSENYIYDLAAVKQLLEAAGYPDGFDIDMLFNAGRTGQPPQATLDFWNTYTRYYDQTNGLVRVNPVHLTRQEFFDRVVYAADFKGIQMSQPSSGTDVDYLLFRNYSSKYHLTAFPDPELDRIIDAQREAFDPQERAEYIKDFQRYQAKEFYILPGQGRWNTFEFQWDWVRNVMYRGQNFEGRHKEWLIADMPNRDG